ncbi:MAG: DUF1249 domain-containing protein [Gammaproteobacteria bacterium]|nr:DUF1249 domain-containing protein [Gammaproteobacteria bacterium]
MASITYKTLSELPGLYEENYRKLGLLFPGLRLLQPLQRLAIDPGHHIELAVVAQCRYTSILTLLHRFNLPGKLVSDLSMTLRLCHDAGVAEVIHYQQQRNFGAVNPYPNARMHQPFEKYRVNDLLCDWLNQRLQHLHRGKLIQQSSV